MIFWIFPKTNIEQKNIFHYAVLVTHISTQNVLRLMASKPIFVIDIF